MHVFMFNLDFIYIDTQHNVNVVVFQSNSSVRFKEQNKLCILSCLYINYVLVCLILRLRLSPAARQILSTHGLDPHLAVGTGLRGLITKE